MIDAAKAEKDWDEPVPYEKKTRGKIFVPKQTISEKNQNELSDMGFDIEFDENINTVRIYFILFLLIVVF